MTGYAQLDSDIIHSTIWGEPDAVRIVWVTMLAMADARGYVGASVPGLAHAARVSLADVADALTKFQQPDPYSRDGEYEGRRIEECEGGWLLLNYRKRRDRGRDPEKRREQNREAQARRRAKQRDQGGNQDPDDSDSPSAVSHESATSQPESANVSPESAQAEAEAYTDQENPPVVPPRGDSSSDKVPKRQALDADVRRVFEDWKQDTGHHRAKLDRKRAGRIRARLNDGFTAEQLTQAITNRRLSPWLMGTDPKSDGTVYDGIETLLRDTAQVEKLLELPSRPPRAPVLAAGRQPNYGKDGFEGTGIRSAGGQ